MTRYISQLQIALSAVLCALVLTPFSALAGTISASCASYLVKDAKGHSIGIVRFETIYGKQRKIIDVSDYLIERHAYSDPKLRVINLGEIFSDPKIFMGFGRPNAYLAIPHINAKGLGYSKVDAKSLWREETKFIETQDKVQSGLLLVFKDLPSEAAQKILNEALAQVGSKGITCVNTNCKVLSNSGFTIGGESLSTYKWPTTLMRDILKFGLEFEGKTVEFDLIKTTPGYLEDIIAEIDGSGFKALCRHAEKHCSTIKNELLENTYLTRINDGFKNQFGVAIFKDRPQGPVKRDIWESEVTRITVPEDLLRQYNLGVSEPTELGYWAHKLWGPHSIFAIDLPEERVNHHLSKVLKAYPDANPNLVTRAKHAFFNKTTVNFLNSQVNDTMKIFDGLTQNLLFDLLRTHSDEYPNKYNFVVTGDKLLIMKNDIQVGWVDWIASKHILISNDSKDVRFAGELWKTADGKIHINNLSGTYQPGPLAPVLALCNEMFPGIEFVIHEKESVL